MAHNNQVNAAKNMLEKANIEQPIGTDNIHLNVNDHGKKKGQKGGSPKNVVMESVTYPYGGNQAHNKGQN